MVVRVKRVYEAPEAEDGQRILVDRLWPRGISREKAAIDEWLKVIAPSDELRKWFAHDPEKWELFQSRYRSELESNPDAVEQLCRYLTRGPVTLLYAARESRYNNARVLQRFLQQKGVCRSVEQ